MVVFLTKNSQKENGYDVDYFNPSSSPNCCLDTFWNKYHDSFEQIIKRSKFASKSSSPKSTGENTQTKSPAEEGLSADPQTDSDASAGPVADPVPEADSSSTSSSLY